MKRYTYPLFAALIGFSAMASAEVITEDIVATTDVNNDGYADSYTTGALDLSSFINYSNITLDLLAAGDYTSVEEFETITFKLDDIVIAHWAADASDLGASVTSYNVEDHSFDPSNAADSQSYKTLSSQFSENSLIDDATYSTFGEAWSQAIQDGQVTISWINGRDQSSNKGVNYLDYDNERVAYSIQGVSAVPEPSTYALMLAGLGLVGFMAHRRKKA